MRSHRVMFIVAAVALVLGSLPALAQQDLPKPLTADGRLMKVDADSKTITIRTASDIEMVFRYDEATKVTGGDEGVAGLATSSGTDVKVTYLKRGQDNVATEVAVQKKPA